MQVNLEEQICIVTPSVAILKMQKEIDELNQATKRSLEEIMKLQREKQDLLKLNFVSIDFSIFNKNIMLKI
jgi:hypothetical protein